MKEKIFITHSSHLDLFWMGTMEQCMAHGSQIIRDAVEDLLIHHDRYFVIESVRFLEYYLTQNPDRLEDIKTLLDTGQLEVGACYTDRLENHHDGESLVRNILYGQEMLQKLTGHKSHIAAHPDLPGLTEQTPQIYKKSQVEYYLFARGYQDGARFLWQGQDGSSIVAYNYPVHYTYYNFHTLMEQIASVKEAIHSEEVLLSCSAGDLGKYDTFVFPGDIRTSLSEMLKIYNTEDHPYELVLGNIYQTLKSMPADKLPKNFGESPCRWGTYGSATNVDAFRQDKELSARLSDAEKLLALCRLKNIDCSELPIQHPFKKKISSHDIRCYFDKKESPVSPIEWIDFAWRLQITTQDHNYGGIGGITSDFDRQLYKKCAREITDTIISCCTDLLANQFGISESLAVFNTLNWNRSGTIMLDCNLDRKTSYAMVDNEENYFPVVTDTETPYFEAVIPALGYKCFRLTKTSSRSVNGGISLTDSRIQLENCYYCLTIDTEQGAVTSILDLETQLELSGETSIGILDAYEDLSVDVHEELYDKKLLDTTQKHPARVSWGENDLFIWVRLISELCDSKTELEIRLHKLEKSISIIPVIFWNGRKNTQIRMRLGLTEKLNQLIYGIPYGTQQFGHYMEGAYPANPVDEISDALFEEYREVQGWFSLEKDRNGISICTNQSSFAFKKENQIEAVLIRTVQSCGDSDVTIANHGRQEFQFHLTSYQNDSVTENDAYYKKSWSYQHPLYSAWTSEKAVGAPAGQLLEVTDSGILSVLRPEKDALTARFFSVASPEKEICIRNDQKALSLTPTDLLGDTCAESLTLKKGDIKTICVSI